MVGLLVATWPLCFSASLVGGGGGPFSLAGPPPLRRGRPPALGLEAEVLFGRRGCGRAGSCLCLGPMGAPPCAPPGAEKSGHVEKSVF